LIKTRPNGRVFCGFLKITVDANNQMRRMRPTSTGNAEKQLPNITRKPYVKRFTAKCFENKIFKKVLTQEIKSVLYASRFGRF